MPSPYREAADRESEEATGWKLVSTELKSFSLKNDELNIAKKFYRRKYPNPVMDPYGPTFLTQRMTEYEIRIKKSTVIDGEPIPGVTKTITLRDEELMEILRHLKSFEPIREFLNKDTK